MYNLEQKVDLLLQLAVAKDDKSRSETEKRIEKVLNESVGQQVHKGSRRLIEQLLVELGMPCSLEGWSASVLAIELVMNNGGACREMFKTLYPRIIELRGIPSSTGRVERAIRHAIEVTWERITPEVEEKYFGLTISADKGMPTNSEFISRCANIVLDWMRG